MTTKRLFVAIDLPDVIRQFLAALDPGLPKVRWVDADRMHLTLGFFGNVPEFPEQKLKESLRAIKFGSFILSIQEIGTFPPKGSPKIIWIGVGAGHPHLFQIHKRVQEAAMSARLEPDLRPWHPHITLARCRDVSPQAVREFLGRGAQLDAGMIRVDAFSLYSSELTAGGSVYTRELTAHCR